MKTMQNFAAQQLSKKQMNQVRGGNITCRPGEIKYMCSFKLEEGSYTHSETYCATSKYLAEQSIKAFADRVGGADAHC